MKAIYSPSLWLTCALLAAFARTAPARSQEGGDAETLFVTAERLYVRPGELLEPGQLVVERGIIVAVGSSLERPEGAQELSGKVGCAGFIDPWSTLGVARTDARADDTSAASLTTDSIDLYADDDIRRDALRAGVTSARVQAGSASEIGGVGAVVRLAPHLGREEALVLADSNMAASVGVTHSRERDVFDRLDDLDKLVSALESGARYGEDWVEYRSEMAEWEKAIAEKEEELEKDFKKAKKARDKALEEAEEKGKEHKEKKYKEDKKPRPPKYDGDKQVMARVVDGELPLIVHVHGAAELRGLLELTEPFGRLRLVVAGGTDALPFADELASRRIPVIVWPAPVGQRSERELSRHDLSLAAKLAEQDVQVLIGSGGRGAATRDLPLLAGLAIGHGLARDQALAALTVDAARALDVADRLGSLERGKDADIVLLDGDPLLSTTRVQYVITNGRVVLTPED